MVKIKNKFGFSLVEILLAISVFAIFSVGIVYLALDTLNRDAKSAQNNEAVFYAQEGLEAVRNIRDKNYLFLTNGNHGLVFTNNEWDLGLSTEKVDDLYERTITVSDVYRNEAGNIDDSGDVLDQDTKKVDVKIAWLQAGIIPRFMTLTEYMSNWRGDDQITTTCDEFNAGTFSQSEVRYMDDPPVNNCGVTLGEMENKSDFYSSADIGYHALDVEVEGNYVYLGMNDASKALNIIDVTDHANPRAISSVNISGGKGKSIKKDGDYVYVSTMDGAKGFAIVNVTNPEIPVITKIIPGSYSSNSIDTKGNYAYVGIDSSLKGLQIYDVTSKTVPILKKAVVFPYAVRVVKIHGDNAYIGLWDSLLGLRILDISAPLLTKQINSLNAGEEVNSIIVSGNVLFLGTEINGRSVTDSLKVVDISGPNPVLVSMLNIGGQVQDMSISGDYLYVATDQVGSGLVAVNIANPYNPHIAYVMDVGGKGNGVDSDANYVYVATGTSNKGLVIVGTTITGVNTSGTYVSEKFDTGSDNPVYNFIGWDAETPPGGSVKFQVRTSGTSSGLDSAIWVGPDGTSSTYYEIPRTIIALDPGKTGSRYFQYKAFLTSDGVSTPTLEEVRINYIP
jgi:prepilin-type N-terminal cleavage/methylation domain-containing protein